jgi:hypothetical protein
MNAKTLMMTAGAGTLLVATATAQANSVVAEQIFQDDAGNVLPSTHVVLRVYWQADAPEDQLLGVSGSPTNNLNINVTGGTFFDSTNIIAGDRPVPLEALSLPGFEEVRYDSWYTIGNSSLNQGPAWPSGNTFTDQVLVPPGTSMLGLNGSTNWSGGPAGPDNVAWTAPPSMGDPGTGDTELTPQTVAGNWADNRVLMMQLSIVPDVPDGPISVTGEMGLLIRQEGNSFETPGSFEFALPAPGALALLGIAGIAGTRRRRG